MMWDEILKTLGGMGILVAALTLSKSLLTLLFSKDLEKFKSDLQVSSQQSIEAFKSSLQIEAHRRHTEFSELHAKRAEFIAELYTKLLSLYRGILDLSRLMGHREYLSEQNVSKALSKFMAEMNKLTPEEEEKAKALQQTTRDFFAFYSEKKIYFSPKVCELIEEFWSLTTYMAIMYENVTRKDEDNNLYVNPFVKSIWDKASEKIPKLLEMLEKEFRLLLGVLNEKV